MLFASNSFSLKKGENVERNREFLVNDTEIWIRYSRNFSAARYRFGILQFSVTDVLDISSNFSYLKNFKEQLIQNFKMIAHFVLAS